jgi:hypothetical protein
MAALSSTMLMPSPLARERLWPPGLAAPILHDVEAITRRLRRAVSFAVLVGRRKPGGNCGFRKLVRG